MFAVVLIWALIAVIGGLFVGRAIEIARKKGEGIWGRH